MTVDDGNGACTGPSANGDDGPDGAHGEVSELIAAWALGAAPPGDDERVRAHMDGCAKCAAEGERLGETVRLLAGAEPVRGEAPGPAGEPGRPDGKSRGRLMAAARAAQPGGGAVAEHAAPYAAAVSGLLALLRELDGTPARWGTPVVHDWDVRDTLAHLIATDEALAEPLGVAPVTGGEERVAEGSHWRPRFAARTEAVVAYEHTREPAETMAAWHAQARALLQVPQATDRESAAAPLRMMGVRLPIADHYVIRAFETWVHTRDIGRALGRTVPPPLAAHLQRLVGLSVKVVDMALGATGALPVLLSIEGEVGGEWVLGSDAEPIAAELVLDAVDFCLLVGGRQAPREIARGQTGDAAAVQRVLETAASLAWL